MSTRLASFTALTAIALSVSPSFAFDDDMPAAYGAYPNNQRQIASQVQTGAIEEQGDLGALAPAEGSDDVNYNRASARNDVDTDNNSIQTYSGGIGEDEINYIHSVQNQYSTKLLFTENNGEYLSDLPLTIRNSHGDTVVKTVTNGPVLLVNLPAGSYTVTATEEGASRDQKISVTGRGLKTFQFRFPDNDPVKFNN